jgi:two-component system response regulator DevR
MIVSPHEGVRAHIADILGQWPDFEVSSQEKDSYAALYAARAFKPHVALVDEEPSLLDCPALVSALKRWSPHTRAVVLASRPDNRTVLNSIAGGAAGYVLKEKDTDLIPAVVWVRQGGALMTAEVASRAFGNAPGGKAPPPGKLDLKVTRAELNLLARIGKGLSNKEIAAELCLKDSTIRNYVSALLRKTGLRSRTEIALFVHCAGILGDGRELGFPASPARAPAKR